MAAGRRIYSSFLVIRTSYPGGGAPATPPACPPAQALSVRTGSADRIGVRSAQHHAAEGNVGWGPRTADGVRGSPTARAASPGRGRWTEGPPPLLWFPSKTLSADVGGGGAAASGPISYNTAWPVPTGRRGGGPAGQLPSRPENVLGASPSPLPSVCPPRRLARLSDRKHLLGARGASPSNSRHGSWGPPVP